jgi:cytochrome P450
MLHDERRYPDPSVVSPDRLLGKPDEQKHVTDLVFGFGRRRCPGYHFAEATLFTSMATVLATCKIEEAPENIDVEYTPEILRYEPQSVIKAATKLTCAQFPAAFQVPYHCSF